MAFDTLLARRLTLEPSTTLRYFRELLALREQLRERQQNEEAGLAGDLKAEVRASQGPSAAG